jgi:hypothetical protein
MYVTAQHVRSSTGKDGINAFRFGHQGMAIDWSSVDLSQLVEQHDRKLLSQQLAVPPGGNSVISYLDVAGSDETPVVEIEGVLRKVRESVKREIRAQRFGALQISFLYNREGDAGAEYDGLASAVLSLFRGPSSLRPAPLTLLVTRGSEQSTFALDKTSIDRLARIHQPGWHAANVSVSRDIQHDLDALHGDPLSYIVQLITGLDRDQLFEQGGVVLVDGATSRRLAAWPRRE